jgi:hypothetical protein
VFRFAKHLPEGTLVMSDKGTFDWAAAVLAIASTKSENLGQLARAAELDPLSGDLSDIDLSGLDLTGQDFRGWDLRNARFSGARLSNAELRNARLDPAELIGAVDWEEARLDDEVRAAAQAAAVERDNAFMQRVVDLELSVRTTQCLSNAEIVHLGQLVQKTEAELMRLPNFGRKSLNEVNEVLAGLGFHLGMELDWKPR